MAIQKKSLISGKSTPKKATSTVPEVSGNPGVTRTRIPATKLSTTRMAATRMAATRMAATRIKVQM